jgi:hypothetical protein
MQILQDILKSLSSNAPIEEVRRGVHLTAVKSRFCGLSSTMMRDACHEREAEEPKKPFTEMTACELARYALSDEVSRASLGLAAINSLVEIKTEECVDIDGLKLVREIGEKKNISVVGHFPFLEALRDVARNLWIIEKHPLPGDYPEECSRDYLPQSDIVVMSATTLINHTLPGLLAQCRQGSVRMLLGPTTPMSEVLFDYGIDVLSGSMVIDIDVALKAVSEGANFIRLKKTGAVRFVTMTRDRAALMKETHAV